VSERVSQRIDFYNGTGAQYNQRFERRRCQLQIDRDGLTFGRTPQTIRRPVCGLGTVTERNRKCLLQKDAVNLSSLTGPAALAGGLAGNIVETAAFSYRVDSHSEVIGAATR
jgi:hypothetical protein